MALLGSVYFRYNAPGCFIWADVEGSGRVRIIADLKFQHQSIESVVESIREQTKLLGLFKFSAVYADPEMFPPERENQKIRQLEAESPSEVFARFGLPLIASGGNRVHGWQRCNDFLRNAPDGKPWLIIHPRCKWLLRTLPALVQTKADPDDCEGEEYAANALRFLLASRPTPSLRTPPKKPYAWGTVGWLRTSGEKKRHGVLARHG